MACVVYCNVAICVDSDCQVFAAHINTPHYASIAVWFDRYAHGDVQFKHMV